ncbi:conserved protein of unknown function [Ectopseudomonas oleovorans]|uniref:Uncharacterized protein n=1 Tax=Ectopseudomonas oleovorans TaxID=301 RepID=A0A653BAM5_ECTOL|nr:conserved protein of unknown function [Pseudomonas oleovorans]
MSHLPTNSPAIFLIWAKLPFSRHLTQLQGDPFLALRKLVAPKPPELSPGPARSPLERL